MHCTYCGMPKGTSRDKAMSNSAKIKPVALAVIELRFSEGTRQTGRWAGSQTGRQLVSQAVSQSAENSIAKVFFKFCSNLFEAFRVVLKALLGIILNHYCQSVRMVLQSWFLGDMFSQKNPNLHDP